MSKAKAEKPYRKLMRGRGSFFGHCSYWLARDHVLLVTHNYFVESYARFYFEDIRGITLQRKRGSQIAGLVCAVVALMVGLSGLLPDMREYDVGLWVTAGSILLFAVLVYFFGANCSASIQTPSGVSELQGLQRRGKTMKFITKLEQATIAAAAADVAADVAAVGAATETRN